MLTVCCAVFLKLLVLYFAELWLVDSIRTYPAPPERGKWAAVLILRLVVLLLGWYLTGLPPLGHGAG